MTTFENGPARGQTLMLKRSPYFLRVVVEGGKWDALDQPGESPRAGEAIHAYRLCEIPGSVHIHAARGGGGFFNTARYQLIPQQPAEVTMRELDEWVKWCQAHRPANLEHAIRVNGCRHEELDMDGCCKLCGLGGAPAKT